MTLKVDEPLVALDPIGPSMPAHGIGIDEPEDVLYPDSDGEPVAENTLQFDWILFLKTGFDLLYADRPDVFVAGDLLWYSVRGDNRTRLAPDSMVVFGRPKGYRGSYRQWEEGGIAPQVVFEVLSPGNTAVEMANKRQWYAQYGAEEYYEYDPDNGTLHGWLLQHSPIMEIASMRGWGSPRMGVTFGLEGKDLVLIAPDGKRFQSVQDIVAERDLYAAERDKYAAERDKYAAERDRYVAERDEERSRAERLAARLRALGLSDD